MATTLQFRRGTTSELNSVTGAEAELFVDTTKNTVVVMDGSTAGGIPLATEAGLSAKANTSSLATVATTGSYTDLSNKPSIPTAVSQLTNDSGYITSSALSTYATQSYVTTAISNVIDAAPVALDTLNELAAALGDDANFASTVTTALSGKQATLVSGTNIKTVNNTSLLGSGNITIAAGGSGLFNGSINTTVGYALTNSMATAATGNATSFGTLTNARSYPAACSGT